MDTIKLSRNNFFKRSLAFLDGFYRRFFMTYVLLVIATRFSENILMGVEEISAFAFLLIVLAAILISILWTKLDSKVQLSIFDRYLTGKDKQSIIFRRIFWVFVFYTVFNAFVEDEKINGVFELAVNIVGTLFFTFGIIVLITSALWISVRRKYKMNFVTISKNK